MSNNEITHTSEVHTVNTPLGEVKREQCLSKLGFQAKRAAHARAGANARNEASGLRPAQQNTVGRIAGGNSNGYQALGKLNPKKYYEVAF